MMTRKLLATLALVFWILSQGGSALAASAFSSGTVATTASKVKVGSQTLNSGAAVVLRTMTTSAKGVRQWTVDTGLGQATIDESALTVLTKVTAPALRLDSVTSSPVNRDQANVDKTLTLTLKGSGFYLLGAQHKGSPQVLLQSEKSGKIYPVNTQSVTDNTITTGMIKFEDPESYRVWVRYDTEVWASNQVLFKVDTGCKPATYEEVGKALEAAAAQYGIPQQILKAVAWQENQWQMCPTNFVSKQVYGKSEVRPRIGLGVLQVTVWAKDEAAYQKLRQDVQYSACAGAMWLSKKAGQPKGTSISNWKQGISDYNGATSDVYYNAVKNFYDNPPSELGRKWPVYGASATKVCDQYTGLKDLATYLNSVGAKTPIK